LEKIELTEEKDFIISPEIKHNNLGNLWKNGKEQMVIQIPLLFLKVVITRMM